MKAALTASYNLVDAGQVESGAKVGHKRFSAYEQDGFTRLDIFVVSLRCDHSCNYCQVSRQTADLIRYDMTEETAERPKSAVQVGRTSPIQSAFCVKSARTLSVLRLEPAGFSRLISLKNLRQKKGAKCQSRELAGNSTFNENINRPAARESGPWELTRSIMTARRREVWQVYPLRLRDPETTWSKGTGGGSQKVGIHLPLTAVCTM
jgi:hypothetical protein